LFNERGLRPRRLLDHLVELEGLPGSQARVLTMAMKLFRRMVDQAADGSGGYQVVRSEEHTSELQSRRDLVCRLLLEKKKKQYAAIGFMRVKGRKDYRAITAGKMLRHAVSSKGWNMVVC